MSTSNAGRLKPTMRLWLLCAALSLIASQSRAQFINACGKPTTEQGLVESPDMSACAPAPFGMGTMPTVKPSSAGAVAWWYCPTAGGNWILHWRVATAQVLTYDYMATLAARLAYAEKTTAPVVEINNLTALLVNKPLSDPALAAIWCPQWDAMWKGRPASNDGASIPPLTWLIDSQAARWQIVNGWAVQNGVQTNGHATAIRYKGGAIYVLSPTGGYWWRWTGANTWIRGTTTPP